MMADLERSDYWKKYTRSRKVRKMAENLIFSGYRFISPHRVDRRTHSVTIPECTYSPWNFDPQFNYWYKNISEHTLVEKSKLYMLMQYVSQLSELKGDIIEVGAWRGGSGCLLAAASTSHTNSPEIFICDTFEGMPATTDKDNSYRGGELSDTSADHVRRLADSLNLKNVTVLKGIFPEETSRHIKSEQIKFAHIDVDIYSSARNSCSWVWERLVPGGVIVFDDYGYSATEGVTKFVEEFRFQRSDCLFIYNLCGQGIFIKR